MELTHLYSATKSPDRKQAIAGVPQLGSDRSPVILIPAYKPTAALPSLVLELSARGYSVVVVNDGSGPEYCGIFDAVAARPNVTLLTHAINLGKGAALRTAMNEFLVHFPDRVGVVTADADGQHRLEDILAVASRLTSNQNCLTMGTRSFEGRVPLRSRFGNSATRQLVRLLVGRNISDTQTGLRGIPTALIKHMLRLRSNGYEFELDMLVLAKHLAVESSEVPIASVYIDGNRSSHFNPLRDSLKIYFVLFRFSLLSLATALLDNAVFAIAYLLSSHIAVSQIAARLGAIGFNYFIARRVVFLSRELHSHTFPRYLALAAAHAFVSYALLTFLHSHFSMSVLLSKLSAESLLFCASFALQRDFVFTKRALVTKATQ